MARMEKKTTKTRSSFQVRIPSKKRVTAAISVATTTPQLLERYRKMKSESRARMQRLCRDLLGPNRRFTGQVRVPAPEIASQTDAVRLRDIKKDFESGKAIVYWVDGADRSGFLGAGVVWHTSASIQARFYKLGRSTGGGSGDAELFGIAAAVHRAKRRVRKGHNIKLVRVYSDAQGVLGALKHNYYHWAGPMNNKPIAIRDLYEDTDWLVSHSCRVELIWVKGHSASNGNRIADEAASKAVSAQIAADRPIVNNIEKSHDIPDQWKRPGRDWSIEWLYRKYCQHMTSYFNIRKLEHDHLIALFNILEMLESIENNVYNLTSEYESDHKSDDVEILADVPSRGSGSSYETGASFRSSLQPNFPPYCQVEKFQNAPDASLSS